MAAVSEAQVEAAGRLWRAAAGLLAVGVPGGGAVAQAELLRAGHEARAVGLHAASAAAVGVVEQLRALRREEPGARLSELTDVLRELLTVCHRLAGRDAAAIGVARRDYAPVGDLRLYGLFCEPVQTATGHAGAVTYLADERGRIWTVSDVKPADPSVAKGAMRASVQLGEVRLSHRDLARAGLRAINAHASEDGRLSHGRARQAVATEGAAWSEAPLDALWQADPRDQVERWLAGSRDQAERRLAGGRDLAFLDGTITGIGTDGLRLALSGKDGTVNAADGPGRVRATTSGTPVDDLATGREEPDPSPPRRGTGAGTRADGPTGGRDGAGIGPAGLEIVVGAPIEDPAFPYVTNLRLLAHHALGRQVRLVGRFTGPRRVAGLAIAAPWLRDRHVDLGAQTLTRADLLDAPPNTDARPTDIWADDAQLPRAGLVAGRSGATTGRGRPQPPPLHLVRHLLERVVGAGRAALLGGTADDARALQAAQLDVAAALTTALGAAGTRRTRDVFGRLDAHQPDRLARAWLAVATYERGATAEVTRTAWR